MCAPCARGLRRAPAVRPPAGVDAWNDAFVYQGPLRELIATAKFRRAHAALEWLADTIVDTLPASSSGCDVVTWPPTTRRRRRSRGYDQAELLARAVARRLRLPAVSLLVRSSPAQAGRNRVERVGTPRFVCSRTLAGAAILIVDDVATTGATLTGAAAALRTAAAGRIEAAVAARKP